MHLPLLTPIRAIQYYALLISSTFMFNIFSILTYTSLRLQELYYKTLITDHPYYRIRWYYAHALMMIYQLVGIELYVSGEITQERVLWISNHRSKLDGLLLQGFLCASRSDTVAVTKKSIEYIPMFGSFGNHTNTIFIARNREKCESILASAATMSQSILIFPEGCTMQPSTKARSDAYAIANDITPNQYVMVPRTTGIQILKQHGNFDRIGNLTIRYDDPGFTADEDNSFLGLFSKFPRAVYIDVKYTGVNADLNLLFDAKDKMLSQPIDKSRFHINGNYRLNLMVSIANFYLLFYFALWWCPFVLNFSMVVTIITSLWYLF